VLAGDTEYTCCWFVRVGKLPVVGIVVTAVCPRSIVKPVWAIPTAPTFSANEYSLVFAAKPIAVSSDALIKYCDFKPLQ